MAKLTAKQLKALPDSMFGLPKTRQYPMPDKAHVIKAIQFFKYCKDSDKPELARNINRRAKELKMQIKVQPSSAFYKYADKSILKEATMVQEFHIGQLAPIVTLEPQIIKMNFGNGTMDNTNGPLERLQKLWGSNKSLGDKDLGTANIVSEAVRTGYPIDANIIATLEGIDELKYMSTEYNQADYNMPSFVIRSAGRHDMLYVELQNAINNHKLDDIINILRTIDQGTLFACAIALISYTSVLTAEEKRYVLYKDQNILNAVRNVDNNKLHNIVFPDDQGADFDPIDKVEIPMKIRMSDTDIFNIDQFINLVTDTKRIRLIMHNMIRRKYDNKAVIPDVSFNNSEYIAIHQRLLYNRLIENHSTFGLYTKNIPNDGYYYFIKDANTDKIYCAMEVQYTNLSTIFMVAIYDYNNPEYNQNVLAYFMGSDPVFKIITRVITMNTKSMPKLEATDFKDLYNGIQINKNGNVSFLLDELDSWQHKYDICKQALDRNMKDTEYEQYKNNLCALYSMINVIYNKYDPALNDTSSEAKQALNVMDKSVTLFKDSITAISKVQPEFNFINYYMSQHYNDKINVFRSLDDKELRDEATISYRWIMG